MTLHDTPFKYYIKNPNVLSKLLTDVGLMEDFATENLIQYLATADKRRIGSSSVQVVDVGVEKILYGLSSNIPGKIFVREFYDELVKQLEANTNSILLWNPGTSKSGFQLYIMYNISEESTSVVFGL